MTARNPSWWPILLDSLKHVIQAVGPEPNPACHPGTIPSAIRPSFTGDERPQRPNKASLVGLAGNRSASQPEPARGPPVRARRAD